MNLLKWKSLIVVVKLMTAIKRKKKTRRVNAKRIGLDKLVQHLVVLLGSPLLQ